MISLNERVFCSSLYRSLSYYKRCSNYGTGYVHPVVYFSGIQPTGIPHLGNYFGLIRPWLALQKKETTTSLFLSVVDYHSISSGPINSHQMKQNIINMVAGLLACGVDPNRTIFFQQSAVFEHTNLMFILGMMQTVSQLKKLTHYKEKSAKFKDRCIPVNLLIYPVLQTADILLYKSTHVPVGEDQTQHLRLSRDLASRFNNFYKVDYFPVPEQVTSVNKRIKSLREPGKKMSKSDPSPLSRIDLNDSRKIIFEKCSKALSDFQSNITYEPIKRPAVSNLVLLYCAVNDRQPEEAVEECADLDTQAFKMKLAEDLDREIAPIREKFEALTQNQNAVIEILNRGAEKARKVARKTLKEVKDIMGLTL